MKSESREILGLGALVLFAAVSCASQDSTPANWLEPCTQDQDCGSLLCLSGSCTVTCRSDRDCDKSSDRVAHCYQAVASSDDSSPSFVGVCAASSDGDPSAASSQPLVAELDEVPLCPDVARTTSLPPVMLQGSAQDYEGPAIVADIRSEQFVFTDTVATLSLTNQPGSELFVRYRGEALGSPFAVDGQLIASFRTGGEENLHYSLLVLRDPAGRLMLATHHGADALYRAGLFDTPEIAGFQLTLDPLCSSAVAEGCFEHQTQAEYRGIFVGDERLVHDGSALETLYVDGRPYTVQFWSSSVDGGKPLCTAVPYPGRYIDFTVF